MKRHILIALAAALLVLPTYAQTPAETPNTEEQTAPPSRSVEAPQPAPSAAESLFDNYLDAALQGVDRHTDSSKFEEYRDVPHGLAGPSLRVFGDTERATWLITAEDIQEETRRFDLDLDTRTLEVRAFFDQIPHGLGNNAHSILARVSDEAWGISDLAQLETQQRLEAQRAINPASVNFAFLNRIAESYVNTPYVFDLGDERRRTGVSFGILPESSIDTTVTYYQENREGTRAAGTSFGFGNVVETGEPIDYTTREASLRMETPFRNGLVRGAVIVNEFENRLDSYTFDNPWRATDSTDANAYQAPGSASINGASFGRIALAPNSRQITVAAGGVYKLPYQSRITADVSYGHLTSSAELIPFTTNTSIFTPSGERAWIPETLPAEQFNGEINSLRGTLQFTSRPIRNLNISARLRTYDLDNDSPRIRFEEGYTRFDAVWEDIPRITVPYGWTNNRLDLFADYDLGIWSFEGGYRYDVMERTFRETEETTEGMYRVAVDVRPFTWLSARTSCEFGSRDFDHYDPEHAEHASFLEPGDPANLTLLRRYDQAARDSNRIVSMVQLAPFDAITLSANFVRYFDDYDDESDYGLLESRNQSLTIEGDYSPSARWSVFAFWTRDDLRGFQRGRQSGGTLSANPADDWTADLTDKAKTFGLGGNYSFIPDRLTLNASARLQRVDGRNQLESPAGGTPDQAFDIENIDDTRFLTITSELNYALTKAWNFAVGGWFEDYTIDDALQEGVRPYMPGGFFLVPDDADYRGVVAYVRGSYRW